MDICVLVFSTVEMFIHMRFCWQDIAPFVIHSRRHQTSDMGRQERWKDELKEAKMEISCISAKFLWAKQYSPLSHKQHPD